MCFIYKNVFEPVERIELSTSSLPRKRSTPELHWRGAEDEVRTRDPQLGRLMLYQLSYFRKFARKFAEVLYFYKFDANNIIPKKKPVVWGFFLWARMDSNHRRHRQQIYSLSHLTALVLAHLILSR